MDDKILIIEDEAVIRRELKVLLECAGYRTAVSEQFVNVLSKVREEQPDLILLDVNLPGCSGFDLCVQLREQTDVPVIFLTGRTDAMDELNGILRGGDDYITKPYHAPVLLARIAAVLKRSGKSKGAEALQLIHEGVRLDMSRCCLIFKEHRAELTRNEMKILYCLFRRPGEYVSRMDLIEYLWEQQIFIDDNTLSVHMTRIREKLRSIQVTDFIKTKRGVGYRI
ncbi:MAG: response regulator transcription factor [Lachnospiraceae bacterium]|nr:response regulator transcription factor [Lachnospiraceae bacterium]